MIHCELCPHSGKKVRPPDFAGEYNLQLYHRPIFNFPPAVINGHRQKQKGATPIRQGKIGASYFGRHLWHLAFDAGPQCISPPRTLYSAFSLPCIFDRFRPNRCHNKKLRRSQMGYTACQTDCQARHQAVCKIECPTACKVGCQTGY